MIPDLILNTAPQSMQAIWNERAKILQERQLWVAVMITQRSLGWPFPDGAIDAYQRALPHVYFDRINDRERILRHDVKARLEEFNHLAGFESAHLGMTSADVVDNVSQIQVRDSMRWMVKHYPSQCERLVSTLSRYKLRGIKGAVGTMQDQETLLGVSGAQELDRRVADDLGFPGTLGSVGQMYHRSLDLEVATEVACCIMGLGTPAWHPDAIRALMNGYITMLSIVAGDTWNEGDVSSSVVRRVALPGVFCLASIALQHSNT